MSIEYTIDIQLTELGFPDILQPQESEVTCQSTSSDDGSITSHSSTAPAETQGPTRVLRSQQSKVFAAPDIQDKQVVKHTACRTLSESAKSHSSAGQDPTGTPLLRREQDKHKEKNDARHNSMEVQQNEADDGDDDDDDDDSEDSDVSEAYEEEEFDEEDDDDEEEEEQNGETGDYRCSVCDLQLSSKFKLQDHMNLHTGTRPYRCVECGKRFCQIYNYRVHLRTHAKVEPLRCRICMMPFKTQKDLKDHLSRYHLEDKFYECDQCKRVFTTLEACEVHVQLHRCAPSIVCELCGRSFTSQKALKRHRNRTKCRGTFKCTDCPKTFTKKNALLKHSFSHLGLLPYTCIRCRSHFRLAKLYRQHQCRPHRIHCVACLREFLNKVDFEQHKKDTGCWGNQEPKSDEIRCLECGQRFDTPEELKQHAGAHQRVLKCAECGKGFRSALLLMSHMGGHAGQSPCLCQSCGLGFPHQQNYDSHLKTCGHTSQPLKRESSKSSTSDKKNTAPAAKKKTSSSKKNKTSSTATNKTSSVDTKKPDVKPTMHILRPQNTSHPPNAVTPPVIVNNSSTPTLDSCSPGPVTEGVSVQTGPDGLWKLALDKQPPPGIILVLSLPVCATQPSGMTIPAPDAQTIQVQTPPLSGSAYLGGAVLNVPMNLVPGITQDPKLDQPLDLSKKCTRAMPAPSEVPLEIKCEPGDVTVSGEGEGQEIKNSNTNTNDGTKDSVVKNTEGVTASSGVINNIKKEPQSPRSHSWPSTFNQPTDLKIKKEVKMEVDIPPPPCPGMDT